MDVESFKCIYALKTPVEKLRLMIETVKTLEFCRTELTKSYMGMNKDAKYWESETNISWKKIEWLYNQIEAVLKKLNHGENQTEINRRSVLMECLFAYEDALTNCSKSGMKLEPLEGKEATFDALKEKCEILRGLIQALQAETVEQAMDNWKREQKSAAVAEG